MDKVIAPITGSEILEKRNRIPNIVMLWINDRIESSFEKIGAPPEKNLAYVNKEALKDCFVEHIPEIRNPSEWKERDKIAERYFMELIKPIYMKAGWAITEEENEWDASDDCYVFEWVGRAPPKC